MIETYPPDPLPLGIYEGKGGVWGEGASPPLPNLFPLSFKGEGEQGGEVRKDRCTMGWIVWEIFTAKWLQRAERGHEYIDDGDRFISLWIAFNGWMKGKFGENKTDRTLLNKTKELTEFSDSFNHLKQVNSCFKSNLEKLANYSVADMRNLKDRNLTYDGTFESLIEVLYRVRCNLFHGRKEITENKKDIELMSLSLKILLPLFKTYLSRNSIKRRK